MTKRLLLAGVLLLLCLAGCRSAGAQTASASASAMLVKGGQAKLAVSASYKLATVDGCDLWGDMFLAQSSVGAGLSTSILQVLQRMGIGVNAPQLLEGLRGGMTVLRTGGSYDGGLYLIFPVAAKQF